MRQIALLVAFLLVFGSPAGLLAASAPPASPGGDYPVPPEAAPGGSTPERTSNWNNLSPSQQQQHIDTFFNEIVPQAIANFAPTAEKAEPEAAPPEHPLLGSAVSRPPGARESTTAPTLVRMKDAPEAPALPIPCAELQAQAGGCDCPLPEAENLTPTGEPIDAVHIVANPTSGTAPLTVHFSVSWSQPIQSYHWSFGDGGVSYSSAPSHTYSTAGTRTVSLTVVHATNCATYYDTQVITVSAPPPSAPDLDADGLPDSFEDNLAYAFRPVYHVSAGERVGTGFANFGNYVPQTVTQVFGSVPARNHVRIKPLGFTWVNGQHSGVIQIDYFTMWNRDDGLVINPWCSFLGFGFFDLLYTGLDPIVHFSHALDNERSAVLVVAPSVGGTYNTSPSAYKAYDYYTAAHEGTFNDKSRYIAPQSPVPAYNHVLLGTAQSKHATYTFNPDGLPLFPAWLIWGVYDQIFFLYWYGYIDFWTYLAMLYIADVTFYVCAVEHFIEQGGAFPGASKNFGDVGHAINGSGFIEHTPLRNKLNMVLWYLN